MRSIRAALVAAAVLATTLIGGGVAAAESQTASVSAASAACYSYPNMPARVSMDRYITEVRVSMVDSCYSSSAYVYLYGPRGIQDAMSYSGRVNGATDIWSLNAYFDQPGSYRAETAAFPADYSDAYSPDVYSTVKYGSKAALTAKRSGNRVTLTACASYYNGQRDAFVPWQRNKATIQQQTKSGGWVYVQTVTLNSSGCASHTYSNKYAGTYRVTTYETSKIWPRTSGFARA